MRKAVWKYKIKTVNHICEQSISLNSSTETNVEKHNDTPGRIEKAKRHNYESSGSSFIDTH